jgi:hypothetical protein
MTGVRLPPGTEVLATLVVPQEVDAVAREPRSQGEVELAGGDDVQAQTLFCDHTQELRRGKSLC